jgi:hypothetical protein
METLIGCGVAGHKDSCLCDVVIDKVQEVNASLVDNWVLAMVADYFDLSWPWTPDKFGFLLEKASVFLEEYSKSNIVNLVAPTHIQPQHGSEPWPNYVGRVKRQIEQIVFELGPQTTPTQVFELCGINHNEMVRLLTMNRTLGEEVEQYTYDKVVQEIREGKPLKRICRENNLPAPSGSGQGLVNWLKKTFVTQFQEDK